MGERFATWGVQNEVVGDREGQHESVTLAVLGYVGETGVKNFPGRVVREIAARHFDGSRLHRTHAGQGLDELGLPISLNSGEGHNLSGAHVERHVIHDRHAAVITHHEVAHAQQRLAGFVGVFLDGQIHITADHERGQFRLTRAGKSLSDDPALADDGDDIRDGAHFAELVGNKENGLSGVGERTHNAHEGVDFLGREHCRRLVEDEKVGVVIEGFQNLHALLDTDGQVFDHGVGVDVEAVARRGVED